MTRRRLQKARRAAARNATNGALIAGLGLVAGGFALIALPAGLIVAGVCVAGLGLLYDLGGEDE